MHRTVVFGATGRMGRSLVQALLANPRFELCGAIGSAGGARLGTDAAGDGSPSGVLVTSDVDAALRTAPAVAIDFSVPEAVAAHALACAAAGVPLLVGATGLDGACRAVLTQAAARIAVLVAPNTSVGVNVLAKLVELATRSLGEGYDVDILEAHHRAKRDAPSGTALSLGEAVAAARTRSLQSVAVFERHGAAAARAPGSVGFAVVRGGDIVGEHTVIFAGDGERIEIAHRATDRQIFARGALRGAEWLIGRPAGLYGMSDVLGI